MSTKAKGDLLEDIVEHLCSDIKNASVTRNAKIVGRNSNDRRDIDVLIEGYISAFPVKILVEAKNYKRPVGVEKVESLKTKLDDIGANLGVIACPSGFTKAAKQTANSYAIKLYEVYDPKLGNSNLFIPLRYVASDISGFSFELHGKSYGPISIPQDISRWQFHVGNRTLGARQLVWHAWNTEMIPQLAGEHIANFNAMTMGDIEKPDHIQYIEVKIHIVVVEEYYLKLVPASFLRELGNGKEHHNIDIHLCANKEDLPKYGWKKFQTFEEMTKAADIDNQPEGVRELIMRPTFTVDLDRTIETNRG